MLKHNLNRHRPLLTLLLTSNRCIIIIKGLQSIFMHTSCRLKYLRKKTPSTDNMLVSNTALLSWIERAEEDPEHNDLLEGRWAG